MVIHSSPAMEATKSLLVFGCLFTTMVLPVAGQTIPTFDNCPSPLVASEDAEVGSTLFTLRARANGEAFPANNLTFNLESDSAVELVSLTPAVFDDDPSAPWPWSSDVILQAPLDRDFEPSRRTLAFQALDTNNNIANLICILNIVDVNDNAPSFQGLPFDIEVSEMTQVGTTLRAGLSASDPDTGVGGQVFLQAEFPDSEVAQTFNTATSVQGSGQVMDIVLARTLDYETRTFYTFNVRALDGENLNSTAMVRVTVTDSQDTPPVFLLDTYRAAITEHQPVGTPIITISAVDGDSDPPNGIIYSIVNGRTDYFHINATTGSLTSLVEFDRDNVTMVDTEGVFHLTVWAMETADVLPQYGNTSSEVEVVVVVDDINDHPPTFSRPSPYTAFVREDTPSGALIYFDGDGYISVSDADQGRNSHFNLTVERDGVPWPALAAAPTEVYSEGLVLLRVIGTDVFREASDTHVIFQLVAREVSTIEGHSSTAEVVLTVQRLPEPSPTPTPAQIHDDDLTAPDIIVFVIGFLVVFNVVATVLIVCFVWRRWRSDPPRQGRAQRGSKYYVHGVEKGSRASSSGFQNGSALSLRSAEHSLGEVEVRVGEEARDRDRCNMVSHSAVPSPNLHRSSDPASINSAEPSSRSTDRRALLPHEVSPAQSGLSLNASLDSMEASPPGGNSVSVTTTPKGTVVTPSTKERMPNFSKAKRNVSSPKNPALNFPESDSPGSASASSPAFRVNSQAPGSGPMVSSGSPSVAEPVSGEAVTRFSAQGSVSTSTVPAPAVPQPPSDSGPASMSGCTSEKQGDSLGSSEVSMSEILY